MKKETTSLRIKAEKLGTVSEVTTLLNDLEFAYNSIYAFVCNSIKTAIILFL